MSLSSGVKKGIVAKRSQEGFAESQTDANVSPLARIGFPLIIFGVLIALFWPSLCEAASKWKPDSEYEHAYIVLPATVFLIWRLRDLLAKAPKSVSWLGLPLIAAACAIQTAGYLIRIKYVGAWAFPLASAGAVLLLYGPAVLRILAFPIILPLFVAPIPNTLLSSMTLHLQTLTSAASEEVVRYLGYPVIRDGNVISIPGGSIEVAEACSGLHKSLAFLAFAALFGYMMGLRPLARVALLAVAIPVAMLVNVIRVSSLIAISATFGEHAFHMVHAPSDIVAVGIGFLIFLGLSRIFQWSPQKSRR